LRFYLDSFDDNTKDPLQLDINEENNNGTKSVPLESGPNSQNYIKANGKMKIFLKTTGSSLRINKLNFGVVNLYFKLNKSFLETQHNSFNKFNCNGQILFNNEFLADNDLDRNLTFTSRNDNQSVFVYLCSDSFDLSINEKNHIVEFAASKHNY